MEREVHEDHKLAHYARACTDVVFKFPFGTQVTGRHCHHLHHHHHPYPPSPSARRS